MKKLSLFISLSSIIALQAMDDKIIEDNTNNQDLVVVCDNCPEEIYPLEDHDTIGLISEIQNYIDDLEVDPVATQDIISENIVPVQLEIIDINLSPTELNNEQIEQESNIVCQLNEDLQIVCNVENMEQSIDVTALDAVNAIIEDQIQEQSMNALDIDKTIERIDAQLAAYEGIKSTLQDDYLEIHGSEHCGDCPCCSNTTISIDDENLLRAADTGIVLIEQDCANHCHEISDSFNNNETNQITVTKDDIVPVPHDLINSVKKAAKKKKKIEKKERKSFFKKSKKNKKSC
jgi:hypothetical protein